MTGFEKFVNNISHLRASAFKHKKKNKRSHVHLKTKIQFGYLSLDFKTKEKPLQKYLMFIKKQMEKKFSLNESNKLWLKT